MDNQELVRGIIYPLPGNIVDRFSESRNIFVKYLPHILKKKRSPTKLKAGDTLYIYKSGSEKTIIAEAAIKKIEFLFVDDVLNNYKNKTLANEDELRKYSEGRESKQLLVLTLNDIKKYKVPIKAKVPITMAGRYVTFDNKNQLMDI